MYVETKGQEPTRQEMEHNRTNTTMSSQRSKQDGEGGLALTTLRIGGRIYTTIQPHQHKKACYTGLGGGFRVGAAGGARDGIDNEEEPGLGETGPGELDR